MTMTKEERMELRGQLLEEMYDFYFENEGKEFPILDKVRSSTENRLAYVYLKDAGLIKATVKTEEDYTVTTYIGAKITVSGIDLVESK